jgi:threonine synthase
MRPASGVTASDAAGSSFRTVCTGCGRHLQGGFQPFCSACGGMADIEYDLTRVELRASSNPYVRFQDLLPIADPALLPVDATYTPTVHATRLGEGLGMTWLYLKDETKLPTGTTKDRMAAIALAYLHECGVKAFCTSSTGNSSTAYAHAISGLPGLMMYLFTASRFRHRVQTPSTDRVVHFLLRDATFVEAFDAARDYALRHGLVSERGFFNPGRREGLKLAWLEAADQVPRPIDWYVQAVSSAMGVYGVFKAARELQALGRASRLPRLLCVQQETCAPMVSAWRAGSDHIRPQDIVHRPNGIASAILRGNPTRAYPPVRRNVLDSGGTFTSVSERAIRRARQLVEDLEGVSPCFSAAAAVAGLAKLRERGDVPPQDTVLVNLTGADRASSAPAFDGHWLKRSEQDWVPEDPADHVGRSLWEQETAVPG